MLNTQVYFILFFFSFFFLSCGSDDEKNNENLDSSQEVLDSSQLVEYQFNLHESLPSDWVKEFNEIFEHLKQVLPVYQNNFSKMSLYSWKGDPNSEEDNPYPGVAGGAYIGGNSINDLRFVMEIPTAEFEYQSLHRYSVIPHEYFHTYQMSLSSNFSSGNFKVKWLSEGTAALVESIYIQQKYDKNYYREGQTRIDLNFLKDPTVLESYDNQDMNYSSSVFLVLVLAHEIKQLQPSLSEALVFKKILKTYFIRNSNQSNWKDQFKEEFGLSLDDFYNKIKTNYTDVNLENLYQEGDQKNYQSLLPSTTLKLEDIFTK